MNELYNRIQKKAIERGLTVGGLCVKAGVNKSRLTDLKTGRVKTLNPETLRKLAIGLGTTVEALMFDENDKRIIHLDMDEKNVNFREMCERLKTSELLSLLNAATREIQRRQSGSDEE